MAFIDNFIRPGKKLVYCCLTAFYLLWEREQQSYNNQELNFEKELQHNYQAGGGVGNMQDSDTQNKLTLDLLLSFSCPRKNII